MEFNDVPEKVGYIKGDNNDKRLLPRQRLGLPNLSSRRKSGFDGNGRKALLITEVNERDFKTNLKSSSKRTSQCPTTLQFFQLLWSRLLQRETKLAIPKTARTTAKIVS